MTTSATTNDPGRCPLCEKDIPATAAPAVGEAACPQCKGSLWFSTPGSAVRCRDYKEVASLVDKLMQLISEKLGVQKDQIQLTSSFQEDLGADSLDVVEFIMDLEEKFGVTVPDQEAERLKTVAEVVDYVLQHRAK